ncbi:hypothetical protein JR316_0011501 [Psilocybe cubensis]|uniref:Uncharacterized protein n=2 Tax=Psilocybe cubensis TaxID=181762 RepID=A0A8H8CIY7_PSICU|nr:hypothetical protein JR316_0011501 [Psilocybe cubensis]KAH9475939.1 hypothetical protein JR316_0011501 [Psilocybe cubensis]
MEPDEHHLQLNARLTLSYSDHDNPLYSRPRSTSSLSQLPPEKNTPQRSTPLDGDPPAYDPSDKLKRVDENHSSPTKAASLVSPTSVEKRSKWWAVIPTISFSRTSNRYSSLTQREEEFTIDQEIYSVIISLERENIPVFNLAAKLGDERDSKTTIIFRCTATPSGKFKDIRLYVRFFDTGSSNLMGINKKDEKLKIVEYTNGLVLNGIEVEHGHGQEVSLNLGANAAGATGAAAVTKSHDIRYTKMEGAEVYGALKSNMSEVCWTWTAPNLPNAVLKGDCNLVLKLKNVRESMKVGFRVECKMDRGINILSQGSMEAPKKQKPRVEHVVTRLKLNHKKMIS